MFKLVALLSCAAVAFAAPQKYVYDYLKPALNAAEVQNLLATRGIQWPTLNALPANINFNCASKNQPGFYADTNTQCQVFHRCDLNGNMTSFLCTNTTVFNQITLTCDYWYNVDCKGFASFEDFANSRLYKENMPLFDSPPADYVAPSQLQAQQQQVNIVQAGQRPATVSRKPATPAPRKSGVSAGGSAAIQASSRSDSDQDNTVSANVNTSANNQNNQADNTGAEEATTEVASTEEPTTTTEASS